MSMWIQKEAIHTWHHKVCADLPKPNILPLSPLAVLPPSVQQRHHHNQPPQPPLPSLSPPQSQPPPPQVGSKDGSKGRRRSGKKEMQTRNGRRQGSKGEKGGGRYLGGAPYVGAAWLTNRPCSFFAFRRFCTVGVMCGSGLRMTEGRG